MAQRPPLLTPSTSVDHSAVAGSGTDHQQNQQNYSNSAPQQNQQNHSNSAQPNQQNYSNSAPPPNNASLSNFAGTLFKSTKRFTVSQFTCQALRTIRENYMGDHNS